MDMTTTNETHTPPLDDRYAVMLRDHLNDLEKAAQDDSVLGIINTLHKVFQVQWGVIGYKTFNTMFKRWTPWQKQSMSDHGVSPEIVFLSQQMGVSFWTDFPLLWTLYTHGEERTVLVALLESTKVVSNVLVEYAEHLGGVDAVEQPMSRVISYLTKKATSL